MVSSLHPARFHSAQHSGQKTFLESKAGPTMPRASPQPGEPVLTVPCLQAPRCGKTLHHITQLSAGSLRCSHTGLLAGASHPYSLHPLPFIAEPNLANSLIPPAFFLPDHCSHCSQPAMTFLSLSKIHQWPKVTQFEQCNK